MPRVPEFCSGCCTAPNAGRQVFPYTVLLIGLPEAHRMMSIMGCACKPGWVPALAKFLCFFGGEQRIWRHVPYGLPVFSLLHEKPVLSTPPPKEGKGRKPLEELAACLSTGRKVERSYRPPPESNPWILLGTFTIAMDSEVETDFEPDSAARTCRKTQDWHLHDTRNAHTHTLSLSAPIHETAHTPAHTVLGGGTSHQIYQHSRMHARSCIMRI